MNRALAHRDPDASGVYVDREIALGHRRLAVIDPAGGVQPRIDEESGDVLVFNGEIYDYPDLADRLSPGSVTVADPSDTKVLVQFIRKKKLTIGSLTRNLFWERCRDVVLCRSNPVAGWFERRALERLLGAQNAGRRDHAKTLWALYVLFRVAERRFAAPAGTQ